MVKLNKLILESGYKKDFIAKQIGVSKHTVTNWVNGYTSPTIKQAQKLKEILHLDSIDELIDKEAS